MIRILAIVGATVVSLSGGASIPNAVVLIEGDRIRAVGPREATPVPGDARVIRADGLYLVPGLLNLASIRPRL